MGGVERGGWRQRKLVKDGCGATRTRPVGRVRDLVGKQQNQGMITKKSEMKPTFRVGNTRGVGVCSWALLVQSAVHAPKSACAGVGPIGLLNGIVF